MPQETLFPSDIRRSLLDEHLRLTRFLSELEDMARRVLEGDHIVMRFERMVESFRRALDAHNETEEAYLEPLLRSVDAWGPLRAEQLLREHAEEHSTILALLEPRDVKQLAGAIPEFAHKLRAHIRHEEASYLHPEVLRDDLTTSGPSS